MSLADLIRKHDAGSIANAKPAKAANDPAPKIEPLAGLATLALANAPTLETVTARRWQVCFPGIDPMEVIFAPEATRAEVATLYPGARLDALPDSESQGPMPIPDEAAELPGPVDPYDDRRTCRQCANPTAGGRCLAASRGELSHVASRNYFPVPGLPCRCAGYAPRADDPDRRPGRERWPFL